MNTESPCIRICKINKETKLCEGCFRTLDEIASWTKLSDTEKHNINERVSNQKSSFSS